MITDTRHGRRIGCGITGLAATVAIVTGAAPAASADVAWVNINPPAQTYYVGTSYRLAAGPSTEPSGSQVVSFYDNGQCIGTGSSHVQPQTGIEYAASVSWIPATAGQHVITADDGQTTKALTITVVPALAGSTPATPVSQRGCDPLSRLQTGSS
ncbi:hypothetical protein ACQP06_09750 [Nocardia sp. CA-136227]|uniref:hypothetical protein n=1 Tax=Nocardia sp. CA-136227 TaxID=3239979 RepID=UPI003D95EA10